MQPIFIVFMGFFWLKGERLTKFDYTGIFSMIVAALLVTTKTLTNLWGLRLGSVYDLAVLSATIA
ncbi:MAG: hypothetical protein ACE5K3_05635 [bacterium]